MHYRNQSLGTAKGDLQCDKEQVYMDKAAIEIEMYCTDWRKCKIQHKLSQLRIRQTFWLTQMS